MLGKGLQEPGRTTSPTKTGDKPLGFLPNYLSSARIHQIRPYDVAGSNGNEDNKTGELTIRGYWPAAEPPFHLKPSHRQT